MPIRCIEFYEKIIKSREGQRTLKQTEDYLQNILRSQIKDILHMSEKIRAELLLDYVCQILPQYDSEGLEVNLRKDLSFHNKNNYYFFNNDTSKSLQSDIELYKSTEVYKQVDQFKWSDNLLDNFIKVMYLQLIYDVLGNRAMNEHIAPAINKLKSIRPDIEKIFNFSEEIEDFWNAKNIVVVNLNNVNTEFKKMIPMLLAHKLYKEHQIKSEDGPSYLNIIIDEAHNILSYQSNRESETWKDYRLEVFEEIIKEGRKFGVFMTIASQRPSDISSTIISQLHNYFVHRLVNEHDIEMMSRAISYLDKVSVESLPILATGVCIVAGQLAEMPIIVQVDAIEDEYKPQNETIDVVANWLKNGKVMGECYKIEY